MNREAITTPLIFIWALLFTQLVKAATVAEFMGAYDRDLIYFAAGSSVLGGWIRTILSLQGDTRIVWQILPEALWDTAKALIAGMAAFFMIQALRASGYLVPSEVRFGAVVAAGWSRMAAVDWIVNLVKDWVSAKAKQLGEAPINKTPEDKP